MQPTLHSTRVQNLKTELKTLVKSLTRSTHNLRSTTASAHRHVETGSSAAHIDNQTATERQAEKTSSSL